MRSIHDGDSSSAAAQGPDACAGVLRTRESLAQCKDELETIIAVGRIGYCRLNADAGVLAANAEFKAQLGWPPDAQFTLGELTERIHPDDRALLEAAISATLASRAELDMMARVRWPDVGERWLALRGRVVAHEDATCQLIIVSRDATREKQIEAEYVHSVSRERELRTSAELASHLKDEFLSMFSHELRSPLNAILGWNRILAVKRADDPDVTAITSRIERSAKAQLKMANDLLDLGRIGAGKLKIEPRIMKLAPVVNSALEAFRPSASAKGIEIAYDPAELAGEVYGDPDRLQQVVGNLLSNAIKFTDSGGRIGISLRREHTRLVISVTDTGQGIAPALLPHIFDRFRQGDSSTTRQARGLGLGLALVREIVALHGGSVEVTSEGIMRGSTFTVRLPAMRKRSTEADERDVTDTHEAPRSALAGLSILVVDDEPDARAVVAETLRLEGAQVTVSDSAESAFEALCAHGARFDVVVTDIGMPLEDGYSLIRKLRQMQPGARVVAIALTGYASQSDKQAAIDAGFDVHVAKPVDFDDFVPLIRRLAPPPSPSRPS